jgi:LysM repeat protein
MIPAARLLTFAAVCCSLLTSCQNGQSLGGNDPYVSNYGNDGGYNPYPGQPGYAQGSSNYSSTPTYTPPPAPMEADPYAFNAPTSAPSSSSSSYTAPKKTTPSSKPKTTTKSTAKKSGGSYKVVSGDTLYGIARKRSTTVAKIKSANSLKSDTIRPGQTLKIP